MIKPVYKIVVGNHINKIELLFSYSVSFSSCYLVVRPLLDNGLKGGNSESPERASICNHFGVCMYVCDQATGHSFRPSKLIFKKYVL